MQFVKVLIPLLKSRVVGVAIVLALAFGAGFVAGNKIGTALGFRDGYRAAQERIADRVEPMKRWRPFRSTEGDSQ